MYSFPIYKLYGTLSHVFDPTYPGVKQSILNLGDFWDERALTAHAAEIQSAADSCAAYHSRVRRYLPAAIAIHADIFSIAAEAVGCEKLSKFLGRFLKQQFPRKSKPFPEARGAVTEKRLSSLTMRGFITQIPSSLQYEKIFLLNDPWFAGSHFFLRRLADAATKLGYDIVISSTALTGQENGLLHLLVPELKMAFLTSNCLTKLEIPEAKIINFNRFYLHDHLKTKKQRLAFSRKAAAALLEEISLSLAQAKKVHDSLESYYTGAMDFSKLEEAAERLIQKIKERRKEQASSVR